MGRSHRIRRGIWPLWVDIDQAHLNGTEWVFKISITRVAFVTQPFRFGSPIDVSFGFPDIFAPTGKTEGFESHVL